MLRCSSVNGPLGITNLGQATNATPPADASGMYLRASAGDEVSMLTENWSVNNSLVAPRRIKSTLSRAEFSFANSRQWLNASNRSLSLFDVSEIPLITIAGVGNSLWKKA